MGWWILLTGFMVRSGALTAVTTKVGVCFAMFYKVLSTGHDMFPARNAIDTTRQTSWRMVSCCYRPTEHSHSVPDRNTFLEMLVVFSLCVSESSWIVTARGDAREGKWKGSWRMECVASTLHTTSELGVSSITTADAITFQTQSSSSSSSSGSSSSSSRKAYQDQAVGPTCRSRQAHPPSRIISGSVDYSGSVIGWEQRFGWT